MTSVTYTTYIARTPSGLSVSSQYTGELDMTDPTNVLAGLLGTLVRVYLDRLTEDPGYALAEYRRAGGEDDTGVVAELLREMAQSRVAPNQPSTDAQS